MGASDGSRARRRSALVLALAVAGTVACRASAPHPAAPPGAKALPPQSVSKAETPPPPETEPPVAIAPPTQTLVVLDAGEAPESTKQNIVDTAKAERARRQAAQPPAVVITDKNLGQFAAGQKLTVAHPEAAAAVASAAPASGPATEEYWRRRGRELRTHWREAVDQIGELQKQAAQLRDRFYSTDDPYVRDTQVKPSWDRVLEQIRAAQRVVEESRQKVEDYLEEGRRAGALPGWLREGTELEPSPAPPPATTAEPSEPVVIQEPPPR